MNDESIIQLYFNRIEEAIAETRAKYGRMCRSIAYGILRNHEDAEECENDTYVKAWDSIPPTHPDILSAFLGKITRHLALDRYEYLHAEKRGGSEVPLLLDELAECIADEHSCASLSNSELRDVLNSFLGELTLDSRRIFLLRYWFGDSIDEITKRYGFTTGKVKMDLKRSRDKLRTILLKEGYKL